MKFLIFILTFLMLPAALTKTNDLEKKEQAKVVMDHIYDSFVKIIPYVYSSGDQIESLKEEKNKAERSELLKNLNDISDFFKSAKHVEYFQKPGFRPSLVTINHHLEDTIASVNSNNFLFAQKRMKALSALCVSCHSQMSEKMVGNAFGASLNKIQREKFDSDFSYANYLFLVRRFDEAVTHYEKAIQESLKSASGKESVLSSEEINQTVVSSLRRAITVYTKIQFDYKNADRFLAKYENNKKLSALSQGLIKGWRAELLKWKKFDSKKKIDILQFLKTNLYPIELKREDVEAGKNDMSLLISSGVLFKFLSENPKSNLAPEILYWLAIAERRLSNTYFFSLSDLYLKDCIRQYPQSSVAKKCYSEYADNLEFGFSGSMGTDIPDEDKRELEQLKGMLKQ